MAAATRRVAERAGCLTLGPTRQFIRPQRLSAETVARYLSYKSHYGGPGRARVLNGFNATRLGPVLVAGLGRLAGWAARQRAPSGALRGYEVREVDRSRTRSMRYGSGTGTRWGRRSNAPPAF